MSDETLQERLERKLSEPGAIEWLIDRCDHDAAFLPYWPEMMDFTLPENTAFETQEIDAYLESFVALNR